VLQEELLAAAAHLWTAALVVSKLSSQLDEKY